MNIIEHDSFMSDSLMDMVSDLRNVVSCFSRAGARAVDGVAEVDTDDIKELETLAKALESYLLCSK